MYLPSPSVHTAFMTVLWFWSYLRQILAKSFLEGGRGGRWEGGGGEERGVEGNEGRVEKERREKGRKRQD